MPRHDDDLRCISYVEVEELIEVQIESVAKQRVGGTVLTLRSRASVKAHETTNHPAVIATGEEENGSDEQRNPTLAPRIPKAPSTP